jgi:hypothetical protein
MIGALDRCASPNLSPLFVGRGIGRPWRPSLESTPKRSFGYVALAIRVRGEALRATHLRRSRVGSGPSPQPSPRKSGARERASYLELLP